ncbi:MAG: ferrous iron transport protein A [Crocinitomicaceae bacterium]|nr:ferrous iron transport protein A [Crocinitomicaceae bacterium]
MVKPLSNISIGESAIIEAVEESFLKVKLMEMGLIEGKRLRVLFRAPLGDPMAIDVDGYVLSLRNDEADLISVQLQSADN